VTHSKAMAEETGWASYTPISHAHLSPEVRAEVERRMRQRHEERGALLATVEVRVYEHDEEPQVSFPSNSVLGVETDALTISEIVVRARERLAHWR
jgi:hypothetical protein